jgi:serine/threonine protein kinase/Tol biopolymer transport system component
MPMRTGDFVGPYEIVSSLGAGGMGEVYRARDAKLNRDVAIKVLPELFSTDPERLARFRREAQVLASLNHPNIGHIYGLEDQSGVHALVLELVEGPTLADRIAQGPIPLNEAIPIAKQIADALECAHELGIIHRDLKPANIKLRPDGTVKVLDFGLAKALDPVTASSPDSMNSPTLTARATQFGVIVGTAAYMAPEQARGKTVDRRADIWAFGVVLYEMLMGKRPFDGDDVSITLAAVLKDDVDWQALARDLPPSIVRLLRRCLQREPKRRLSAIADARLELDEVASEERTAPVHGSGNRRQQVLAWSVASAALVSAVVAIAAWAPWRAAPRQFSPVLSVNLSGTDNLELLTGPAVAISPDGQTVAYVAQSEQRSYLFVRRITQLESTRLAGTEDAYGPFFSPRGDEIAFFSRTHLKKVAVTGGTPTTICPIVDARGGSWGDDDFIVFQPTLAPSSKLMRVSSRGGTPERLVPASDSSVVERWPQVLPGSRAVLYSANVTSTNWETAAIMAETPGGDAARQVVPNAYYGRYVSSGHLLYVQNNTLFAVPFDTSRLETTGKSVPVFSRVASTTVSGSAQYAVSDTGTLIYQSGASVDAAAPLWWMDATGAVKPLYSTPIDWSFPQFSPTGDRLAMLVGRGDEAQVNVYDFSRKQLDALTFERGMKISLVWTPSGRHIVYGMRAAPDQPLNLYVVRADGSRGAVRLTETATHQVPLAFHPNEKILLASERQTMEPDLVTMTFEGDDRTGWRVGPSQPFVTSARISETFAAFSPDGKWVAYTTTPGRSEIFVRPFRDPGGLWRLTTDDGIFPTWSKNGEIIYAARSGGTATVMRVSYTTDGQSFKPGTPRPYSRTPIRTRAGRLFDLDPKTQRLVVATATTESEQSRNEAVFVFNLFDRLRELTGK